MGPGPYGIFSFTFSTATEKFIATIIHASGARISWNNASTCEGCDNSVTPVGAAEGTTLQQCHTRGAGRGASGVTIVSRLWAPRREQRYNSVTPAGRRERRYNSERVTIVSRLWAPQTERRYNSVTPAGRGGEQARERRYNIERCDDSVTPVGAVEGTALQQCHTSGSEEKIPPSCWASISTPSASPVSVTRQRPSPAFVTHTARAAWGSKGSKGGPRGVQGGSKGGKG
eukprot:829663-Prorocentrum_minimum.AAC.1